MGLFDWFGGKQKSEVPDTLWAQTVSALPFLEALAVDEKNRLKTLVEQFLAEKEFSTGGGLELSDEICVAIAAQGCLPILELGLAAYRDWVGIVVYPDEFVVPRRVEDEDGVVGEIAGSASGSLKDIVRAETSRVERELIVKALEETGGNVTQAARLLKISRKSLQMKMKELGLRDREV